MNYNSQVEGAGIFPPRPIKNNEVKAAGKIGINNLYFATRTAYICNDQLGSTKMTFHIRQVEVLSVGTN